MARDEMTTGNVPLPVGDETLESIDSIADNYQAEWQFGAPPNLALFLPTIGASQRRHTLLRLIAVDLRERICRGQAARLEEYTERFAELGGRDELPAELIAAEYAARRAAGVPPSIGEYAQRFPVQIDQLKADWFAPTNPPAATSGRNAVDLAPGTQVGDFEIGRLLGKGGFARVYLAKQQSLDRPVALKVSRADGDEGRTLAQLDHPHIVAVFSEQIIGDRKLLAMRYVPGKTLADWMVARGTIDLRRWRGSDLLDWIGGQVGAPAGAALSSDRTRFATRRFAPCMCHVVRDLAGALEHAHQRGVLHCDVKPANILLDVDGRALLMDFNVATRDGGPRVTQQQTIGGTLPYMAPEQLAALLRDDQQPLVDIDARADIYALGVVFYELLAGHHPWPDAANGGATVAVARQMLAARLQGAPLLPPAVASPGLRSIVAKCLASGKDRRYANAGELATDLDRWLDGRPLAVAADRNVVERATKLCRRHAFGVAVLAAVTLASVVALTLAATWDWRQLGRAERMLAQAGETLSAGDSTTARDWLAAAEGVSAQAGLLPLPVMSARRTAVKQAITALAQQITTAQLRDFERLTDHCRVPGAALGQPLDLTADPLRVYHVLEQPGWEMQPAFRSLSTADRFQLSEDITELLLARAVATVDRKTGQDHDPPSAGAARTALDLLDRLPTIHRHLPLVIELRRWLRTAPATPVPTDSLAQAADSEFTYYLAGVIAAQRGEFESAIDQFDLSKARQSAASPDRFWRRFLRGYCCARLGRTQEAIAEYGVCIGLRPDFAWPYNNLGLIYTRQGNYALAANMFNQALQYAPQLAAAQANLGVVRFQMSRFDDAKAAFDRAIELGHDSAEVRANRAAARAALGDREGARADLEKALAIDPTSQAARENLRRLNATP